MVLFIISDNLHLKDCIVSFYLVQDQFAGLNSCYETNYNDSDLTYEEAAIYCNGRGGNLIEFQESLKVSSGFRDAIRKQVKNLEVLSEHQIT